MTTGANFSAPVRFNPTKHHREFMLKILESSGPERIVELLEPLCNNYIDIYTGQLSPEEIVNAITQFLKAGNIFDPDNFLRWIDPKAGYQIVKLDDHSEWVVRKGDEPGYYIHVHPARTGAFTIRFKGSTLKTVFLLRFYKNKECETPSLEQVNQIRAQIGLSPVKKLEYGKGILKCLETFFV
jgi:hypothetical protein